MSGGPVANLPRNVLAELDAAVDDPAGWDWFKTQFMPAAVADTFRPSDQTLMELAKLANTAWGQTILAWLHDLTDRAPYPMVEGLSQQVALAAARHQGRAGVGHVLTRAVAEGQRLLDLQREKSP